MTETTTRVILAGMHGFGGEHRRNIARLEALGRLRLTAFVDPVVAASTLGEDGVPVFADLATALREAGADIVIIATPIGVHFDLAREALLAGADVLLEKPPVPSLAEFDDLLRLQEQTGRAVQVGFQSLGSAAIAAFDDDDLGLGSIRAIGAEGMWHRRAHYWARSPWAGHRYLNGRAVMDGVTTNPLAHAVATALRIAGLRTAESVAQVEAELYRANAIESDDTSSIRITGTNGIQVTCALTLCAPEQREPTVVVFGEHGSARFGYTTDDVTLDRGDDNSRDGTVGLAERGAANAAEPLHFDRVDLLTNLLDHRDDGTPLIVPLVATGAFMRVMDAVARHGEPTKVDWPWVEWRESGDQRHPVIEDIEHVVRESAATGKLFSELGAPWAFTGEDTVVPLRHGEAALAEYRDGSGVIPSSSPRPYLHPVRTLDGVTVSAQHPADHDWHLGLGFAVQDVNGINFWGGRTYVAGQDYQWRDDHGRIVGDPPAQTDSSLEQTLRWLGPDGVTVLHEQRRLSWRTLGRGWALTAEFALTAASASVEFASPGSKGREAAGYGGFFWRLPTCEAIQVFTPDATGEEAVHGHTADWLAWSGLFMTAPDASGPATIVLRAADGTTAADPWFVRQHAYPGIGSALAWNRPVALAAGETLTRRFHAAVCDGVLGPDDVAAVAAELAGLA